MTVDSLRVAAYLDVDLHTRLVEYAGDHGESMSQAIASILGEKLGSPKGDRLQELEARVENLEQVIELMRNLVGKSQESEVCAVPNLSDFFKDVYDRHYGRRVKPI